jgi:class 3 adenylate cyclase/tetratricopeptide (TPR) repeat protein
MIECPTCGTENPDGQKFCGECATPLIARGVAEERKVVSVLFVDVVDSTQRADGADPEDIRALNQRYYAEVRERIEAYGGTIEKYVGDAVMAVFGAPVARTDDAERAVRASLGVLEGIRELNRRHPGTDLQVRAAVCTGEAMVTVGGAAMDAIATGDVVNTAARLQSAAPVGRCVVGAETYRLTRHAFRYQQLEAVHAKGKKESVEAWLVEEAVAVAAERPISATPFVGRARELMLIDTVWERAVSDATPHLVSLIGPAGIGKTRLAQELMARIEREGARALLGRSLPYEEQTPYGAFGQILRGATGIYENDRIEVAQEKLVAFVEGLFEPADVADTVRYLSLVLGLGSGASADAAIHLLFASRRVVELMAEREPVVLAFEDVHWADDALLELVDYLVTHVRDHPVLFLALARPEFLETRTWFGSGMVGQTTLQLAPLSRDESARIVGELAADADPDFVEALVARAEGNPLFLEELAASAADEGGDPRLPGTVRAAIAGRIDALPSNARTVLLHASVVGPTFWRGAVAAVADLDDLDDALEALETRGLIRRSARSQVRGDAEFGFKHALVYDVAYATLPRALRRTLHATIADAIEASLPDPTALAAILAHHYREGGRPERAVSYLVAAGDRARAALAIEEMSDLYSQAVQLAPTDGERTAVRLRRAVGLAEIGWIEEFRRADQELEDLLPELEGDDEIEALVTRSRMNHWTEHEEPSRALAAAALELAKERGSAELEPVARGRLGCAYGMSGGRGDLERAIELQEESIRTWVPDTRPLDLAEVLHLTSDSHYWVGNYARSLEHAQAARDMGGLDPRSDESQVRGAGQRGLALASMGRYEEALEASDAAIAVAKRIGRAPDVVLNYSTMILRDIFWLDEAAERSRTVADRLGPSDFNMPWINARADAINADLFAGDLTAIDRDWPSAWEDALDCHAWERWLITGRLAWVRAEAERMRGRADDAMTWAERALEIAQTSGRRKYETAGRTTLGAALVDRGDREAGLAQLLLAIEGADRLGSPLQRWRSRAAAAHAELVSADTGAAGETHLREAAAIIREVADSLAPERAERYLAAPEVATVLESAR